jgi:Tfp pilus assembly protein PilX
MKLILKTILKFRPNDEGSAIPIVMALGLLMTLIGILGVFKSNEEEITAVSQRNRAKALAAAEKGINDYRLLLDRNKNLALYDQIDHTSAGIGSGWRTSSIALCDNSSDIEDALGDPDIDDGNITINGNSRFGQYKLISYTYSLGDGETPNATSEAQLIVEGRAGGTDGLATARLQVDIPIQPTTANGNIIPALWLSDLDSANTDLTGVTIGNNEKRGDIVISVPDQGSASTSACDSTLTGFFRNSTFLKRDKQTLIIEPISFPGISSDIVAIMSGRSWTIDSNDINNKLPFYYSTPSNAPLPASFPSSSNNAANKTIEDAKGSGSDNTYYYKVNGNLNITGNIRTQNNTKVVLYVDGNLTFDSSSNSIGIAQETTPVGPNTNTSAYLEIYVIGNRTITFTGSNSINIKGFIHAPDANVRIEGSPAIQIIGAIWAKSLKRSSGSGTINILADTYTLSTASDIPAYVNYSSTRNVLIPTISPPDQWRMREIR